jgi:hypothetical protein
LCIMLIVFLRVFLKVSCSPGLNRDLRGFFA